MASVTKKVQITQLQTDGTTLDILHPETTADLVSETTSLKIMTAAERTKLAGIESGATKTTIDSALSTTSTNPVQNAIVTAALNTKINTSAKGVAGGVASLGSDGKVPSAQLPAYVDDVVEYDTYADFPTTGESGIIYIALDTNLTYRWGGTAYVEISASLALGETSSTAYAGDKGKAVTDGLATHIADTDNPHEVTKAQVGLGDVLNVASYSKGEDDALLVNKVDKVTGKELSSNDFTDTLLSKLNGIEPNANNYSLPTASASVLGGIKVGTNLSINSSTGVLSSSYTNTTYTFANGTNGFTVTPSGGTTQTVTVTPSIAVATTSANGLMSSSDKTKLNNIAAGAEVNVQADWSVTTTTSDAYILNKPTALSAFTNDSGYITGITAAMVNALTGLTINTSGSAGSLSTDIVTAGTYSAVSVSSKGLVTAGGQFVEVGISTSQTTPSTSLAANGIFFKMIG